MIKKILTTLLFSGMFSAFLFLTPAVQAQNTDSLPLMSAEELAKHDGKGENKAYYAYEGLVYDVTGSRTWKAGEHFGVFAGEDLSGKMGDAPHGKEVFSGFPVVARFEAAVATQPEIATTVAAEEKPVQTEKSATKWYEGRIKILGFSILGWTGILMGVFFVLNFATCFALPWTKLPLPWKGARPGPDTLDDAENRMRWGSLHKPFAWITIILGILHGIIGFMQMLGIYL